MLTRCTGRTTIARIQPLHSLAPPGHLSRLRPPRISPHPSLFPTTPLCPYRPVIPYQRIASFHSTRPRQDVLFVSAPLFKQSLLYLVRFSLLVIPFLWRYKFFKRFPNTTKWLLWIPFAGISLVVALGLDQSQKTSRWRLLLMTDREEIEWSNQRFDELMSTESILLLPPSDPRIKPLKEVCDRLVQALNDESPVSFSEQARIEKIRNRGGMARRVVAPSATTDGLRMPYRPETGNPEKVLAKDGWALFVIDAPTINAFVLASRDVFCYTGLLALTEGDEDLLAAVIGHEIEHLQERHIVESLGFMALSGVVFDVLRGFSWALTLSFPIVGDAISSAFTFVDRQLSQRAYSRKLETEADWLGMELMAKAGYDPRAAIRLWEILNEAEEDIEENGSRQIESSRKPEKPPGGGEVEVKEKDTTMIWDHVALLRTHPTGQERLEALKKRLPRAMEIWKEAKASRKVEEEVRIAREAARRQKVQGEKDPSKVNVIVEAA
ncbi:hypothetical protein JCM16303_006900 [Sporobolomyces ruberrimus]